MASLRTVVGRFRDELREGIAKVIFWKEGRSWNAEAFWLSDDGCFELEDRDRVAEILETDMNAIAVDGYNDCPFKHYDEDGKASDICFMADHIWRRYEDKACMLADMLNDLDSDFDEENKQEICKELLSVLRMTRGLHDLLDLAFDPETELVTATFDTGNTKVANVACDSGTAMIRDIIYQIV